MRALSLSKGITEGTAFNVLFDACRANEYHSDKPVGTGMVMFRAFQGDEYFATWYDDTGKRLASAIVDQYDV